MRILLIEDDALLGDGIRAGLKMAGFSVDWVQDGEAGITATRTDSYEVCVLDLGLPKRSGMEVLTQIRSAGLQTPVLILSARDALDDKVAGLEAGADDFLSKPFELAELNARLWALIRRSHHINSATLKHGNVQLDINTKLAFLKEQAIELTAKEYRILYEFLSNPAAIRSREHLESRLYGWGEEVASNAIEVHIHHLRKKFGHGFIHTIRGIGYRLGK